jgi:hypothetical protein
LLLRSFRIELARFAAYTTMSRSIINTIMEQQYLLSKARNTLTGATVKNQDLTGHRFTFAQRAMCQEVADQLAAKMTARTGQTWVGYCEAYTPSTRRV